MIIWVNGAFGGGKTATGTLLADSDDRLRVFDPEWVGYLLMNNMADHTFDDFQDLPSWRRLVPPVAAELAAATSQHLVAIQAVLVEQYWDELMAGLGQHGLDVFHVALRADESVLRERIQADQVEHENTKAFRLRRLPDFLAAQDWMARRADLAVDTTDLTPADAARLVLDAVSPRLTAR